MRGAAGALVALTTLLVLSCVSSRVPDGPVAARVASYPPVSFAVMSDLHVYDRALGLEGDAFQAYLDQDRKLLVESEEILATALDAVAATDARFLLVSGDLTKDGEESSHRIVADHLAAFESTGREVWVVPGNHDLDNPDAVRFLGETTERVKHLDETEFAAVYAAFGYDQALDRDTASLSYLAEPEPGLWLLAIDSTDTERNLREGSPEVNGRLDPATLTWISDVLGRALAAGKAVMVLMHHGLVAHFATQEKYFADYLVDDSVGITRLLARGGVRFGFTGHFHAQDVAHRRWDDGAVFFDIETGSLVTWPNPYRLVRITPEGTLTLRTGRIETIPSFEERGESFEARARTFAHTGIAGIAVDVMVGLGMSRTESETLSGQIADAFLAHYAGDERFEGDEMLKLRGLSLMGNLVVGTRKQLVQDLWNDPAPPDRDIDIHLEEGTWQ